MDLGLRGRRALVMGGTKGQTTSNTNQTQSYTPTGGSYILDALNRAGQTANRLTELQRLLDQQLLGSPKIRKISANSFSPWTDAGRKLNSASAPLATEMVIVSM